jgi:hypothetical protein
MESTSRRGGNGNFEQRADDLGEQAREQLEHLRAQADEIGQRIVNFIRERPATSLLLAAAAGYLIGRIVRS